MIKPCIGVLGGMGPAATILFQQRVLEAVHANNDADHIPLLVNMNPQVPSRIDYLIHNRGENPGPVLARMARALERNNVDALAMPCCTAHHFAEDISNAVSIPLLNMVELAASVISKIQPIGCSVGILASPANQKTRLFEKAFHNYEVKTLYPKNQAKTLSLIQEIKANGTGSENLITVQSVVDGLIADGADCILIGCSEFSLFSRQISASIPVIDALDVLTAEVTSMLSFAENKSQ